MRTWVPSCVTLSVTATMLAACSNAPQAEPANVLTPSRDSLAVVVFNETAQALRISGRYSPGPTFVIGEVAAESLKGFIFPGQAAPFQLGVRRVGSSSREPRWLGSLDVVPGDSVEYTISVGGTDRAQVSIRKAGRRRTLP